MARILIGSIAPNIHGINSADSLASDDELILYDSSSSANRKTKLSDFFAAIKSFITSIPYTFDYDDSDFSKIKAAYDEGRPVVMNCRGIMLQLINCFDAYADFYGWYMAPNLGYCCVKPVYATVNSDGKKQYNVAKSYSPLPCAFVAKITESNGVLSDNLTTDDWAFAYVFDLVVEAEYNGLRYHLSKVSGNTRYFYAITADDGTAVIHELTRTANKSTVTWAHRTVSSIGGGSVVPGDIETVEAQLVDLPGKLSDLENDAGYLTTDTLPKYDGGVSVT